jgi:membrane protein
VVLIWVYYTSQIILMGAEITHTYAKHEGSIKQRGSQNDRANVRPLSQPGGASGRRANRAF